MITKFSSIKSLQFFLRKAERKNMNNSLNLKSIPITCRKCKAKHRNVKNNAQQQKDVGKEYGFPIPSECVAGKSSGDRCPYA